MENFQTHLLDEISFCFNILGITESRIKDACNNLVFYPAIPHYNFEHVPTPLSARVFARILMRILNTQLSKNVLFRPFGLSYTYPNMQI